MRTIGIVLQQPGAKVYLDDVGGGPSALMPKDGYVEVEVSDGLTFTYVEVTAVGYQPYHVDGVELPPGGCQIRIGVPADPARPQDVILPGLVPLAAPVPHLGIHGRHFVDAQGQRQVFNGVDQFCAYRKFLDHQDLTPLFNEAKDFGFNLWRVFMMGSIKQNNILELRPTDPGYYENLRPFADTLNQNGIILLATIFVDAQDILKREELMGHWTRVADQLRGTTTLWSGGNELDKNLPGSTDPASFPAPGGIIWSRGSWTQNPDPYMPVPAADFIEFHPVRNYPTLLFDATASPITIYDRGYGQPFVVDEPIGFGDPSQPMGGTRSHDPMLAFRLARHYATECAAAVLHNDYGMRCLPMTPHMRTIAAAWSRGMSHPWS